MRLSFVIPAYNEEKYIGKCLDSVLREMGNDPGIEVIVVDNGSTDGTAKIVAAYPRVKLMRETRPGANSARQAGYLAARGDLIAHIDADTILIPGWIKKAEKKFAEEPELICLSGPYFYYDLSKELRALVKMFYFLTYLGYLFTKFILKNSSVVTGGNYVVRKMSLDKIGGHDTDIKFYGDDSDLARRLNKAGNVVFTFGFPIYSSGRRLAAEGVFTMGMRYGINHIWMILFNKPFSKNSIIVRPAAVNLLPHNPKNKIRELVCASIFVTFILGAMSGIGFLGYMAVKSGAITSFLRSATVISQIQAKTKNLEDKIKNLSQRAQATIKTIYDAN